MITFRNARITYQRVWPSFLLFQQIFVGSIKKEVTSLPLPYKYCHLLTPIDLFLLKQVKVGSVLSIMSSSSDLSRHRHRRHKKHRHHSHRSKSSSRDSSQLPSLIDSLRKEMADNRTTLLTELGKISSRVAVMEGQSPPTLQAENFTHKQSLVSTPEQSLHTKPPQAEQSPLEVDTRETAETQAEEGTHNESASTHDWGDRHEDELPDYNE